MPLEGRAEVLAKYLGGDTKVVLIVYSPLVTCADDLPLVDHMIDRARKRARR